MKQQGNTSRGSGGPKSRAERIEERQREIKRRKRRRDLFIFAVVFVFIAALGTILPLTVFFNIDEVIISGSEYYSAEVIRNASGIETGSNMYRMNKTEIEDKLEHQLPYIGEAIIERRLPDKIEIIVTDTSPALAIEDGSGYTLLDIDGKILETGAPEIPEGIASVKGFYVENLSPGNNITEYAATTQENSSTGISDTSKEDNSSALALLKTITEAVEKAELKDITEYDLSDSSDLILIYQGRLKILLGTVTGIDNKLRLGKETIDKENEKNSLWTGIVDLSTARTASVRDEAHETYTTISPDETEM